ncbi:hypothetical protein CsSME_00044754 [Camellia sinensis var. sinensis]
MATGWVKSLQCKSRASDDVVHHHYHHLVASSSCRKSVQSLKDVIETTKQKPRKKPKQPPSPPPPPHHRQPSSRKSEPSSNHTNRARPSSSARHSLASDPFFPALTELPEGHSSRNVVEIIFHTSWSPKAFSGRIEMVFKVQNLPRTVTRFEEYREILKSMAALSGAASVDGGCEDHARCVADGNEVMRFHCLGQTAGAPGYEAGVRYVLFPAAAEHTRAPAEGGGGGRCWCAGSLRVGCANKSVWRRCWRDESGLTQ